MNLIGVHKGVPLGPQPIEHTQTWDMDGAAANFPDINFVIFHVGLPFLDETCWQLIRYPNLYASLAATINFVVRAPRMFAEILGKLLFWCGEDKIVYGSEAPIFHPQWALRGVHGLPDPPGPVRRATATRSSPTRPSGRSSGRTCSGCTAWTSPMRGPGSAGPEAETVVPATARSLRRTGDRAAACRAVAGLAAGRDLLHGPAVAVRVAEEDEADVVERVVGPGFGFSPRTWTSLTSTPRSTSWARALWMSGTTSCRPLSEPGAMSGTAPFADHDRAARPGRGQLDDATLVADRVSWSTLKPSCSA